MIQKLVSFDSDDDNNYDFYQAPFILTNRLDSSGACHCTRTVPSVSYHSVGSIEEGGLNQYLHELKK